MSDLTLNRFVSRGTTAERTAFTPDPPTPASGPDHGVFWYDTDLDAMYSWNGAAWEAAAVANSSVTNAKLADMAQATVKGRAAGAGTGAPTDLTADQQSTILDTASDPLTRKSYVDGLAANLGKRQRVRAATTANITISTALNNGDSLDGVTLATGDLVLVKNQSSAADNGVYVVGVSPARFAEFDTYDEHPGSLIAVEEGTSNADTIWLCTSNIGGTINSTAIAFSQLVVSGAITQLTGDVTAGPGTGSQAATIAGASLTNAGNSGTALTLDFLSRKFGRFKFTLTGNVTLTLNNPVDGGVYLILIATGAGAFSVVWPGSVLWPSDTAPTITTDPGKVDLVTLVWDNSEGFYYGSFNQNYNPFT